MKKNKLIYRITTGLIVAVMTYSIISFTFMEKAIYPEGAFRHLGLPPYFKWELTAAKLLGILALVVPGVPRVLKELAYAGFAVTLLSAFIAHIAVSDPWFNIIDPLIFLGILYASWHYWQKVRSEAGPEGVRISVQL